MIRGSPSHASAGTILAHFKVAKFSANARRAIKSSWGNQNSADYNQPYCHSTLQESSNPVSNLGQAKKMRPQDFAMTGADASHAHSFRSYLSHSILKFWILLLSLCKNNPERANPCFGADTHCYRFAAGTELQGSLFEESDCHDEPTFCQATISTRKIINQPHQMRFSGKLQKRLSTTTHESVYSEDSVEGPVAKRARR